jgi:cytohesin
MPMGSITVSCAVIYYAKNTNEFLVCRPTGETKWSLPKGKMDEDDGGDEALCAVREMKEETGIDISKDKLIRLGRFDYYRKERGNKIDKDLIIFLYPASHGVPTNYLSCESTFTSKITPDDMRLFYPKSKAKFISDEIGYSYPECDRFDYIKYENIDWHFHDDGKRVLKLALSSQAFKSAMPRLDEGLRHIWFTDEERAFFQAAAEGCIEELQWYIERGNDVDIYDENGLTALIGAVLNGNAECVEYLIKAGADVNFYTAKNFTPLILNIPLNDPGILKMLLNAGADPTAFTADPGKYVGYGTTPFHLASEYGYLESLKIIIDSGVDIHCRNIEGNTALHEAAYARVPAALKMLLEAGADPNATNKYGKTPILNASKVVYYLDPTTFSLDTKSYFQDEESYDCIKLLLEAGADPNVQDDEGCTAMQNVSEAGSEGCVKLLLTSGADLNIHDKKGISALEKASAKGSIDCVRLLLAAGADFNAQNTSGGTALQQASWAGSLECVKLLLESGADINPLGNEGSVLHAAAPYPEITKFLINKGAGVNYRTKYGSAPIHKAAGNSYKSLKMLLEEGADPNSTNSLGCTAMHYAAAADRAGSIKLLAGYGAEPSIHSTQEKKEYMVPAGSTPMHLAARNKHPNCINALAGIGADINSRDSKGRTPLHYAALKNRPECVKALCDLGADINALENIKEKDGMRRPYGEIGRTALHCAVDIGSYRCSEILLNAGADISIKNAYGGTAPEEAKIFNKRKIIKVFKDAGLYD